MAFKVILGTAAAKNAAASYLAFMSTAAWGLASIPIAVAYLEPEQIGLWAIVNALLSYLAWADLGIAAATGRLIAKAITDKDQNEMNQWWTAIQTALLALGFIAISIGLLLMLFITYFIEIPEELVADTKLLLGGGVLILGLTFPIRGVAGILTAEHRYHWAPLVQAASPWINIAVLYVLLRSGLELKAYLYAFSASQIFNWSCFRFLIKNGPNQYQWNCCGLNFERFKTMFRFSGNIAIIGAVESVMRTLPHILLAKIANLAVVPAYNFSSRPAMLGANLLHQAVISFYPGLQRLHITDQRKLFKQRYNQIAILAISMATCGAAILLMINSLLVQALAGKEFDIGHAANTWFAISIISTAFSRLNRTLLTISGHMGKAATLSVLKLFIGIIIATLLWPHAGLTGIAATFALLPLIDGIYAYFRGARNCSYKPHELSSTTIFLTALSMFLTWACGFYLAENSSTQNNIELLNKAVNLPKYSSLAPASALVLLAMTAGLWQIRKIYIQQQVSP